MQLGGIFVQNIVRKTNGQYYIFKCTKRMLSISNENSDHPFSHQRGVPQRRPRRYLVKKAWWTQHLDLEVSIKPKKKKKKKMVS